jgi:ribosomal protein L11 methylase PrmA
MNERSLGASFRDPSGYLFERDGELFRRVKRSYSQHYDCLMESGLYAELTEAGLLIPHHSVDPPGEPDTDDYLTLKPDRVDFVSYPYEWSFSQLRAAALLTLRIQQAALRHGMTLKDASAYNVQFHRGGPVFIDTLSFEIYQPDTPWIGYRQFCQHFLAPLALMSYCDVRLAKLLRVNLDGIPLDLARALLPRRAWLNIHLFMHIRMHAGYQSRYQTATEKVKARPVPKASLVNLLTALETGVEKLRWHAAGTEWADYTKGDSYSKVAEEQKRQIVAGYLDRAQPATVWDLGANTGEYSRLATQRGILTQAFDVDPACVDRNYRQMRSEGETRLLPLLLDLTNPSPGLGWAHGERASLVDRGPSELVMALALIHHLAISNNVPLDRVADWFARLAGRLIVEYVPKTDPKVQILLANRIDVFDHYTTSDFEAAFARRFETEDRSPIPGSDRVLYLMRRRD